MSEEERPELSYNVVVEITVHRMVPVRAKSSDEAWLITFRDLCRRFGEVRVRDWHRGLLIPTRVEEFQEDGSRGLIVQEKVTDVRHMGMSIPVPSLMVKVSDLSPEKQKELKDWLKRD